MSLPRTVRDAITAGASFVLALVSAIGVLLMYLFVVALFFIASAGGAIIFIVRTTGVKTLDRLAQTIGRLWS